MIGPLEYKKIRSYANYFCKNKEDVDDIVNEAAILILQNPPSYDVNNVIKISVQRAKYNFYYKPNTKEPRSRDFLRKDFEKDCKKLVNTTTPEQIATENDAIKKLKTIHGDFLTTSEKKLLKKIIEGYEPEYKDRTHFTHLQRKVNKLLT